ncbi:MAG: aldo/keto reductase [Planctomycetota bacterium]
MKSKNREIDRRQFIKTCAAAGLGSVYASSRLKAEGEKSKEAAEEKETALPQVPKRKLGKTGVQVPSLSLGSNASEDPILLRKALDWGVSYWDSSYVAAGGNSELGIGKFISQNPKLRKELFIVTKESESKSAEDLEARLQTSLERLESEYIDLYIGVYMMSNPEQLTDELKQWAENAKKRGKIRYLGLSTHRNMPACLNAAAKCGWIDAVMTAYNFRIMQDKEMQQALDACTKAGVGVIAMKTQAHGQEVETEKDKELMEHFLKKGFTEGQAKIKAVLTDERISTACSTVQNVAMLRENVAAALDKTSLGKADMDFLSDYAKATCSGYCAGCSQICDSVLPQMPYVSDIMRYLMYYNNYGLQKEARELFAKIPQDIRLKLLKTDYSMAEFRCPQKIPISKLISEAVNKLA